jgi:hypothetical protein
MRRLKVAAGRRLTRRAVARPWIAWSIWTWSRLKAAATRWLARRGLVIDRRGTANYFTLGPSTGRYYPVDFKREWIDTIERVSSFTVTSPERLAALCSATEYVVRHKLPGSFVECGVGRGGSVMAIALTLQRLGVRDRDLYLFDNFHGMTKPTAADVDYQGLTTSTTGRPCRTGSAWAHRCLRSKPRSR